MADEYRGGRGHVPAEHAHESQYPPLPDEWEEGDQPRPRSMVGAGGSDSVVLPSMRPDLAARSLPSPHDMAHRPQSEQHYYSGSDYSSDQRYAADQRHPSDQRNARAPREWRDSPENSHAYPAPPLNGQYPVHPGQAPPHDRRDYDRRRQSNGGRPYDDRRHYDDRREPDNYYPHGQPPPGRPYGGYGYSQQYYSNGGPPPQYGPPQSQVAPRQRTSIACRYCRKRKIRCSGVTNMINGRCTNCERLQIECVFQPVSSNHTTAFVPVSAVPGGVPPGTALYGPFGEPLGMTRGAPGRGGAPTPPTPSPPQAAAYPYPPPEYRSRSPTAQYPVSDYDGRVGGRRPRTASDEGHARRLPPPNHPADEDPRRRSPVTGHSNGTMPPGYYHSQQPQGGYPQSAVLPPRRESPGGPGPQSLLPQPPQSVQGQPSTSNNVMSLKSVVGSDLHHTRESKSPSSDIDRNMLEKLDKAGQTRQS